MASLAFASPILPGGTDILRNHVAEISGVKKSEVEDFHRRMNITFENWFIQSTPQGDMLVVYIEAQDLEKTFCDLADSQEPLDLWLKERAKQIHGIDLNQPPSAPLPEIVYDSRSG